MCRKTPRQSATATTTRPISAQVVLPGADVPDTASLAVFHCGHRMVRKCTVRRGDDHVSRDARCISSPSGGHSGIRREKPCPVHRRPAEQLEPKWGELLSRSPIAEVFCGTSLAIAGMRTVTRYLVRCCALGPHSSGGPGTQMRVGRCGATARHGPARPDDAPTAFAGRYGT